LNNSNIKNKKICGLIYNYYIQILYKEKPYRNSRNEVEMETQKVQYGFRTYNYYKEDGHDVLEHIDDEGFKTRLIFNGTKTKEESDEELLELLLKKYVYCKMKLDRIAKEIPHFCNENSP